MFTLLVVESITCQKLCLRVWTPCHASRAFNMAIIPCLEHTVCIISLQNTHEGAYFNSNFTHPCKTPGYYRTVQTIRKLVLSVGRKNFVFGSILTVEHCFVFVDLFSCFFVCVCVKYKQKCGNIAKCGYNQILYNASGQPVLRTECFGGCQSPRINRGDHLFTAKVKVDCWSSLCWPSICPPPQDQHRWSPFHAKVKVDGWSSLCQSSSAPQDQQCWSPPCWLSIASTLSVDHLCRLLIHLPGSTVLIAPALIIDCLYVEHQLPLHRSLIHPLQDQQCWSPPHWLSIASASTVDRPPPYRFRLSNL